MAFSLSVGLQVVCRGSDVFHPKERTLRFQELGHKLWNVVSEEKGRFRVRYDPMVDKDRQNLCHSSF